MSAPEPAAVQAAGGVVWRRSAGGGVEVVVVHRPRYDDWSLPKGKLDPGESAADAALREVEEETGLRCAPGPELGSTSYRDRRDRPKTVRYWAMAPVGGEFSPNDEVDDIRWLAIDEARSLLSYDRDRAVLDGLAGAVPVEPGRTVLVVRHADAGDRDAWAGPDDLRPLTGRGRAQAQGLVASLDGFAVGRILSSPYVRCVQTVEPLAGARGLAVEPVDELAEGAGGAAAGLVARLASDGARDAVLCTHGDVVAELLDGLAGEGIALLDGVALQKGSTWALAVQGGRVVGARYLDPPSS